MNELLQNETGAELTIISTKERRASLNSQIWVSMPSRAVVSDTILRFKTTCLVQCKRTKKVSVVLPEHLWYLWLLQKRYDLYAAAKLEI